MISDLFSVIGQAITAFITALGNALSGVTDLFYTPATTSGGTGEFTILGILSLVAVGCGLVYWAFRLIRGLISRNRA